MQPFDAKMFTDALLTEDERVHTVLQGDKNNEEDSKNDGEDA